MTRSLSLTVLLALGCTKEPVPEQPRAIRKPRVEVVILSTTSEPLSDAAWTTALGRAYREEAQRCVLPECALLKVSAGGQVGDGLADLGYAASALARAEVDVVDSGIHLASNVRGGRQGVIVELGGVRLEVLGLSAGPSSESLTSAEDYLWRTANGVLQRGAQGTVVVTDMCVAELAQVFERKGRAWPLVLVAVGRPCGPPVPAKHIFATLVVAAGEGDGYSRTSLSLDRNTAALLKADARFSRFGNRGNNGGTQR